MMHKPLAISLISIMIPLSSISQAPGAAIQSEMADMTYMVIAAPGRSGHRLAEHSGDMTALGEYVSRVPSMSEDQASEEYVIAYRNYIDTGSAKHRLKLAALMVLAPEPVRDEDFAKELLNDYLSRAPQNAASMRAFAHLLLATTASHAHVRERNAELENRLKEKEEERQALREQLEALKSIEKTITERHTEDGDSTLEEQLEALRSIERRLTDHLDESGYNSNNNQSER